MKEFKCELSCNAKPDNLNKMKKILAKKTIHMVKDMSDLPESNEEGKINGHVKG